MAQNRREFITRALGAGLAFALFGCRGGRSGSGDLVLTYNTHWTGLDAHTSTMEWMYKEFRERRPDVRLQVTEVAGSAVDSGRKLMAELAAGGGPDILHDITYDQVRAGYALELTNHIEPLLDRFYPEALDTCIWYDKVYGIPTEYSPKPCIWNTGLLDRVDKSVPTTFDELMDVGRALKKIGVSLTSSWASGLDSFYSIVFSYPDAKEYIAAEDWEAEPFFRGAEMWKEFVDAGFLPNNDTEVLRDPAEALFQNDRIVYYMSGAYTLRNRISADGVDPELRNQVAFTPFPEFNGRRPLQMYVATRTGLNPKLMREPQKLEAALDFFDLFTSEESAQRFVSMAESPLGVKIEITEEMAGPLLYKFVRSDELATSLFVLPNEPGKFGEQMYFRAVPNLFATLNEGASAKKAVSVFAQTLRT